MKIPPEVESFLRQIAPLRDPALGIEPVPVEDALNLTQALWSEAARWRRDLLPEEMGLFLLTTGDERYGYGTRGPAAGKVIRYPDDAAAEVAFASLEAFGRALRTAADTGTELWDLPPEQAAPTVAVPPLGAFPSAAQFVADLAKAALFSHVGQPLPADWNAVAITSWAEALDGRRNRHKDNQHLEARNAFTMSLRERAPQDRRWNTLVGQWRPVIKDIVRPPCERLVQQEKLERSPVDDLSWDLLAACMEYEYAAVCPPAFYHRLAAFYLAGHFPCGYQGWYPDGRHEIF